MASSIERLLDDESLRVRASELAEEMVAGRTEDEAAQLVEKVVATRAPVLRD